MDMTLDTALPDIEPNTALDIIATRAGLRTLFVIYDIILSTIPVCTNTLPSRMNINTIPDMI